MSPVTKASSIYWQPGQRQLLKLSNTYIWVAGSPGVEEQGTWRLELRKTLSLLFGPFSCRVDVPTDNVFKSLWHPAHSTTLLLTDFQWSSIPAVLLGSSVKVTTSLDINGEAELSWSFDHVSFYVLLWKSPPRNIASFKVKESREQARFWAWTHQDHAPATQSHLGIDAQHRRIKTIWNMIRFEWQNYLDHSHVGFFFLHTNSKVCWMTAALFKAVLCYVLHRFPQQESVRLWLIISQNAFHWRMWYIHGQGRESTSSLLQKTCWQPSFPPGWGHRTWTPRRQKKTWGRRRSAMSFPHGPSTSW